MRKLLLITNLCLMSLISLRCSTVTPSFREPVCPQPPTCQHPQELESDPVTLPKNKLDGYLLCIARQKQAYKSCISLYRKAWNLSH